MTIIGIDIGGSTTKIVGLRNGEILHPLQVRATDPLTSVYGAFGRYISENALVLSDISEVKVTGVGSTYIKENVYGIRTSHIDEFRAIGLGGLYLSGLRDAVIVSMGTGTAFVHADGSEIVHIGGTGVGGGTLLGLSSELLEVHNFENIVELAKNGDLSHIDLTIGDLTRTDSSMPSDTTASNFGNISDYATKEDKAYGLINMIFQTVGIMAVFAARAYGLKDIVLCGNLTAVPFASRLFAQIENLHGVKFYIPERAEYVTALGAALA